MGKLRRQRDIVRDRAFLPIDDAPALVVLEVTPLPKIGGEVGNGLVLVVLWLEVVVVVDDVGSHPVAAGIGHPRYAVGPLNDFRKYLPMRLGYARIIGSPQ